MFWDLWSEVNCNRKAAGNSRSRCRVSRNVIGKVILAEYVMCDATAMSCGTLKCKLRDTQLSGSHHSRQRGFQTDSIRFISAQWKDVMKTRFVSRLIQAWEEKNSCRLAIGRAPSSLITQQHQVGVVQKHISQRSEGHFFYFVHSCSLPFPTSVELSWIQKLWTSSLQWASAQSVVRRASIWWSKYYLRYQLLWHRSISTVSRRMLHFRG